MIPLIVRLLSFVLVIYILYSLLKWMGAKMNAKKFDPSNRELTDYDKDEWDQIQKKLHDQFSEDDKK